MARGRPERRADHPGYLITKPTLIDWRDKFTWRERAARAEAEEQRGKDASLSAEQKLLVSLIKQAENYEAYFETVPKAAMPDNQAVYAYTNLSKTIIQLSRTKTADDVKKVARAGGLSEEKAEEIRRKILGIV
jgi:hypothetical protein